MDLRRYFTGTSPVHAWDGRWKGATLFLFTFVCASVDRWSALGIVGAAAIGLTGAARLPAGRVVRALKAPGLFLAIMYLVLVLTAGGEAMVTFGPVRLYKDGLVLATVISIRAAAIMLVLIVLFGTTPLYTLAGALEYFKVPARLSSILLFTYRYIFLYRETLGTLVTAAKMRGYRLSHPFSHPVTTVNILVSMLVRSYEQSRRVYHAMCLRGYSGSYPTTASFATRPSDILKTGVFVLISGALLWVRYHE